MTPKTPVSAAIGGLIHELRTEKGLSLQRLAKLATSVVSELHNVLLGLNIFDRDVTRAGDLLQVWTREEEDLLACEIGWRALVPTRFAMLDAGFVERA